MPCAEHAMINNALAIVLYGITVCNCVTAYLQERQVKKTAEKHAARQHQGITRHLHFCISAQQSIFYAALANDD